jgi:hypothetical protein
VGDGAAGHYRAGWGRVGGVGNRGGGMAVVNEQTDSEGRANGGWSSLNHRPGDCLNTYLKMTTSNSTGRNPIAFLGQPTCRCRC